jgi:ABC-type uncharacterized transport system substrate-binding protein
MRRRGFIILVGGAAAWPLAARAQQPPMPVVGILDSAGNAALAFRKGLYETGYLEGRNVAIELRSTEQYGELPALATELVRLRVAVIAALGGLAAPAAKNATTTIPIVFSIGGDPVEWGLVASLNHPGGNITGVTFLAAQLLQKQVGILHDLVPKATVIGALVNPNNPRSQADASSVQVAAHTLGPFKLFSQAPAVKGNSTPHTQVLPSATLKRSLSQAMRYSCTPSRNLQPWQCSTGLLRSLLPDNMRKLAAL